MKIEFNGRVVASLCLGLLIGAIAMGVGLALNVIGPIQLERDNGRATIEQQKAQIQQITATWTETAGKWQQSSELWKANAEKCLQLVSARQSQDPAVQVLNMVRPGLGTAVGAIADAVQKAQAAKAAAQQAAPAQRPLIVTAFSDDCGPNGLLVMGECSTCNPGLHPGTFPDGSVGCIQ